MLLMLTSLAIKLVVTKVYNKYIDFIDIEYINNVSTIQR